MRKTKIICTLGPATKDDEVLKQLMENGMDVARINFSHGSQAEHKVTMDRVKKMRKELGRPVGILLDTSGPEIRIGQLRAAEQSCFREIPLSLLLMILWEIKSGSLLLIKIWYMMSKPEPEF